MDEDTYPAGAAWYEPLLPENWVTYGTAADIVWSSFDVGLLAPLQTKYAHAVRALRRQKERVRALKEQWGWDDPATGRRHVCPLMVKAHLERLPPEEPLPEPGLGGAPPIPFDAFLRAFLLAPFYEVEDNAAAIWRALANNPRYLERCQFPGHVLPDVRSFERFTEVMNWAGLWKEAVGLVLRDNLAQGVLTAPTRLAVDPGHLDGYAGVRKPCAACRSCGGCPKEEQVSTCEMTDIVSKRATCQFPGVKGVFVNDADTEMPYVAVGVNARTFDGKTGIAAAEAFATAFPELVAGVQEVTLDGAFDIQTEKEGISKALGGADVLTPINPRARKPRPVHDARGITHIDPYGVPHCIAGEAMVYRGRDRQREEYLYGCPRFNAETGEVACPKQGQCCPNPGKSGRRYRVKRTETPQVDWDNPQHSAEFKERYKKRTSVERVIGRTKRSFPFERHWGRGKPSLQGHLDKGVLAFHVLASAAHAAKMPHKFRSPLMFHQIPDEAPG